MKTLHLAAIIVPVFFTLFVTSPAYAPCIEGPGINCNNYPPPALSQIHFDKLNYDIQDKPLITIVGVPSAAVHLEIDDSSSNIMFEHDLTLSSNGTARYVLDISYYKSGGYSATAISPISKITTSFTVGMTPSGGMMSLSVDKNSYLPGDQVSILGTGNSNTLIQLSLIDPYGTSIRSAKTFSDKTGHFSLSNFTIPNNAVSGMWQIGATGGVMHVQTQIVVNSTNNPYGIKTDKAITSSPLKQIDRGIPTENISCSSDLELIYKTSNKYPVCVQHSTAEKLVQRGWAIRGQPISYFVKTDGFLIPYDLIGGNMLGIKSDIQSKSIVFSVNTTSSGVLHVGIPRALLDSKSAYSNQDAKFIILVDKQEVKYTETTSITTRTLSIPFGIGAKEIEITAPVGI